MVFGPEVVALVDGWQVFSALAADRAGEVVLPAPARHGLPRPAVPPAGPGLGYLDGDPGPLVGRVAVAVTPPPPIPARPGPPRHLSAAAPPPRRPPPGPPPPS